MWVHRFGSTGAKSRVSHLAVDLLLAAERARRIAARASSSNACSHRVRRPRGRSAKRSATSTHRCAPMVRTRAGHVDRATLARARRRHAEALQAAVRRRCDVALARVWHVLRVGDSRADRLLGRAAGLGERVVTRVKIFALLGGEQRPQCHTHLQLVRKEVLAVRELAIQAEHFLLLLGQRL